MNCKYYGTKECCLKQHEQAVERIRNVTISLNYVGEKELHIFKPWVMGETQDNRRMWTTIRSENPEGDQIISDINAGKLTNKSRLLFASHHHTGNLNTFKRVDCPLR